ncbi:ATP-binding protein [Leifsonia poae]|uniref:ATP-binding protein n=1 Tax=Leifsonia poae TaxID=110933 RepID=UPI001CBD80A2|nr:ATP-binding protein [Leifsonia poae]
MTAPSAGVRSPLGAVQPRNPISRERFERIAGRSVSAFGLVFGLQTLPSALGQLPSVKEPWGAIVVIVVFAGLAIIPVLAIVQHFVKIAMGALSVIFLLAIITWPLLALDPDALGQKPWVWFLCSVFTAFAAVAFPLWLATAYTFITPIAYGFIRALPSGGGVGAEIAGLDALYAIILGGVILVIIAMLRQAASAVDTAQSQALAKYANAVRQHATEVERVQVDAIVHDSVLTTLLSAASARTPDAKELAARMASDAIGHLHAAEASSPEDQSLVGLDRLSDRITTAAAAFSSPFDLEVHDLEVHTLPVNVAEAVYSATVQAMVNSMQHAGGGDVRRALSIRGGSPQATVHIVVTDTGRGFEARDVPAERLGLRVSIRERLSKVGGYARIDSAPGEGTTVTILWPSSDVDPEFAPDVDAEVTP